MRHRGLLVAAVLLAGLGCRAAPAGAHAQLVGSRPADGATTAHAPHAVVLRFDEEISAHVRVVRLIDARGRVVRGTALRGDGPRALVLRTPGLARGAYEVTWQVLAEDDGHLSEGAMSFGVGTRAIAGVARLPGAAPPTADAGCRALDVVLLLAIVGALAMAAVLARPPASPRGAPASPRGVEGRLTRAYRESVVRRRSGGVGVGVPAVVPVAVVDAARVRLLRVAAGGAAGALAVGAVLLVRQLDRVRATAPDVGLGDLLGLRWGALWSARELLLVAVLGAVVVWLREARGPAPSSRRAGAAAVVAGGAVVALVVVRALAGHAAADPRPALAVAVAATHVLGAGVWVGGVAALAVALAAAGRDAPALARAVRGPCGRVAGASVAALAVTGLVAAGDRVASLDALLTTDYGRTLIMKALLVGGAMALGLVNAIMMQQLALAGGRGAHAAASRPSLGLLRAEAGLGLGAVLAAAVLAASAPPTGPAFAAPRPPSPAHLVGRAGDLLVAATARPNRPGPNVVTVTAVSTRRPPPAPVRAAAIRLARGGEAPATVRLASIGPGTFAGGAQLDADGAWRMTASAWRGGRRIAVPFSWRVDAPDLARPVTYSARPLAPLLDRAAEVVVLLLVAAAAAVAIPGRLRRGGRLRPAPLAEPVVEEAP